MGPEQSETNLLPLSRVTLRSGAFLRCARASKDRGEEDVSSGTRMKLQQQQQQQHREKKQDCEKIQLRLRARARGGGFPSPFSTPPLFSRMYKEVATFPLPPV